MRIIFLALAALVWASPAAADVPSDSSASADTVALDNPWLWAGASPTPDVSLQLVRVGRDTVDGHDRVRYKALALGFAPGEKLAAWGFRLAARVPLAVCLESGFVVDSTGRVICDPASRLPADTCATCSLPLDQIVLAATGYAAGEPYRMGVISPDGKQRAYAEAFPLPLESAVDSMRIHLEMMEASGLDYVVVGEGFRPGSKVGITTRSGERSGSRKMIVPASGTFRLEVLPQVEGEPTGYTSVIIDAGHRRMTLEWQWGRGAFKNR
jgi:hypothetical protein